MSQTVPSHLPVFVCYAHIDNESPDSSKRWLDRLLEQLAPLAMQDQVCAWSDKDIETGQDWHDRIQHTLEHTKAAVLLVSPAFLASTYIRNSELPVLLKNAKDRGVVILPVIVRHCLFKETIFKYPDPVNGPEEFSLATLQSANSPTTPLNCLSEHEQDKVLLEIAQRMLKVLHQSSSAQPSTGNSPKTVWNVPLEQNPFFTGREDILGKIQDALVSTGRAGFTGLGGIGKTQTAVEYAYRHKDDYSHILWVKADSKESLTLDFAQLTQLLNLPEKHAQDQQEIVNAVQRWIHQHDHWLLIFDNADDLSLIQPFIQRLQSGHILLTTGAQATGTISGVEVKKLPEQEGVAFLLRRAKFIIKDTAFETIPQELQTQALAIVRELDGLPLALDQAGAYIEETQCGLAGYLDLYRTHGVELLKERGLFKSGHPDPVATTWVLSFQKIEQANLAAAELLRFCAFLHPDSIPQELIIEGASELGPVLGPVAGNALFFNKAIGEILKFSLIHRDMRTKTLDIHRLVQAVILKSLDDEAQHQWIERLARAMKRVFPDVKFENWPFCERLLSQATRVSKLNKTANLRMPEAAKVLNQTALYLSQRFRFLEAEPLYKEAISIYEETFGHTHPYVGSTLNNLAELYRIQGRYNEAEPMFLRSISLLEKPSEVGNINLTNGLNNLAMLYQSIGKNAESEDLFKRTLKIREQILGPTHLDVAQSLNNLGGQFLIQGKYEESEFFLQRALEIREKTLGPIHPDVATTLNNLAALHYNRQNYGQAKSLYQRSLDIWVEALGPTHPDVANCLNNFGELYRDQGNYIEAKTLHQKALAIREQIFGPIHLYVAQSLNNLGQVILDQGQFAEVKPLFLRALAIRKQLLVPTHPDVAQSLNNLAGLYFNQKKYDEAEPLYQRALRINEQTMGTNHSQVALNLNNLAELYRNQGQYAKAEPLSQRALAIREQVLEPTHPDVAQSLNNLGILYANQGKYAEAEPLYKRALEILKETWGLEHPITRMVEKGYEDILKKLKDGKG